MPFYHLNLEDEQQRWALPDLEVFHFDGDYREGDVFSPECNEGQQLPAGWYYWFCFPGCMPGSAPFGPYASEEAALEAAREEHSDEW